MPADRQITVNVYGPYTRNQDNEEVRGELTPIPVWASRRDRSQEDIQQEGGSLTSIRRDWRVPYDARYAETPTLLLEVVDGAFTFDVVNMIEVTRQRGQPDLRRRFVDIQGRHTR